jgi:hypothetical protein
MLLKDSIEYLIQFPVISALLDPPANGCEVNLTDDALEKAFNGVWSGSNEK